jgi:chemotaxis protein methyltransferase CheR
MPGPLFERLPNRGAVLLRKRELSHSAVVDFKEIEPMPAYGTTFSAGKKFSQPATNLALPFKYAPPVLPEKVGEDQAGTNLQAIVAKAQALLDGGRNAECVDYLLPTCSGQDVNARLFFLLSVAYSNDGDLVQALTWIEKSIDGDKLNHCSYLVRANILQAMGKLPEAMATLRQALFLEPEFVVAEFYLANMLLQLGKSQEARKRLRGALILLRQYNEEESADRRQRNGRLIGG